MIDLYPAQSKPVGGSGVRARLARDGGCETSFFD
jgi:hypothetical protein